MKAKKQIVSMLGTAILLMGSAASLAGPAGGGGPPPFEITGTQYPCAVTDVTFGVSGSTPHDATDCFGSYSYSGSAQPQDEEDLINGLVLDSSNNPIPGFSSYGNFTFVAKDDNAAGTGSYGGFNFTLSAPQNVTTGAWTVDWVDQDGSASPNLPIELTFAVLLKSSTEMAGYLFFEETLTATNTSTSGSGGGSFQVIATNPHGGFQELSHMSLFIAELGEPAPPDRIPEIDAVAGTGGLTLLAGAMLLVSERGRRKAKAK